MPYTSGAFTAPLLTEKTAYRSGRGFFITAPAN